MTDPKLLRDDEISRALFYHANECEILLEELIERGKRSGGTEGKRHVLYTLLLKAKEIICHKDLLID